MIRRTYNNLTFAVKVSYLFTFLDGRMFRPRYVSVTNKGVIDPILNFLYKEKGFNEYLESATQEIKDKISTTRQSLRDITLVILIEEEFIMDAKIVVTTEGNVVQEYEYPHAMDLLDFSYPREVQDLGRAANNKISKAHRRLEKAILLPGTTIVFLWLSYLFKIALEL